MKTCAGCVDFKEYLEFFYCILINYLIDFMSTKRQTKFTNFWSWHFDFFQKQKYFVAIFIICYLNLQTIFKSFAKFCYFKGEVKWGEIFKPELDILSQNNCQVKQSFHTNKIYFKLRTLVFAKKKTKLN